MTYDLKGPKHLDSDLNEAYAVENEQRPVADGKMVHAEIQDDWPGYAIHGQQPNALGCRNDEILRIKSERKVSI